MASTSRVGKPRMRSRSVHLPTCIPVASKAVRPRAQSVQKSQVKGKGTGKAKVQRKKSGKAVVVISSVHIKKYSAIPCSTKFTTLAKLLQTF